MKVSLQISHQMRPEKTCVQSVEYCTNVSRASACFTAPPRVQFRLFCSTTPPKDLRGIKKDSATPKGSRVGLGSRTAAETHLLGASAGTS